MGDVKPPYQAAIDRVMERLDASGLPWPSKPKDYGTEYGFPADPTALTHQALGELQGRLAAWHGYAIRLVAVAEVPADILQKRFDNALALKMAELEAGDGKRVLKDTLRARAMASDEALRRAANELIEWDAYVKAVKAQASIFEMQAKSLSREQSRRSDEIRMRSG